MMSDREKVAKEKLDEIVDMCRGLSYASFMTAVENANDILAMLKEQEQMYYTLEHDWRMCRELLKEQEAVKPQDAEMLIVHNGGAEEYVKDIESIVLLAHKDYDIVYCGKFSEGR